MNPTIAKSIKIKMGLYNLFSAFASLLIMSGVYGLMFADGNAILEQLNSELNCQILIALGFISQGICVWKIAVLRKKKRKLENNITIQDPSDRNKKFTLKEKKGVLWFVYLLSLMSIAGAYGIGTDIYLAKQSVNWLPVKGVIIASDVIYSSSDKIYRPQVVYRYTVKDKPYQNNRIMFGSVSGSDPSKSRNLVAQYPVGQKLDVFISNYEPNESVLKTGLQGSGLFIAFVFITVLLLLFSWGITMLRKSMRIHT